MFNPAPYQPLNVFFELKLGALERIYEYPNIPLSFELKFGGNNKLGLAVITLFDEVGLEVEPYIWAERVRGTKVVEGTFKFGYTVPEGIESEEYTFHLHNYRPRYKDRTWSHTLYCFVTSLEVAMSSNQYCGTLEEIIDKMCSNYNWQKQINPPFGKEYMLDAGGNDKDTTEPSERRFISPNTESDWRGLTRLLYYARDKNGKSGYRAVVQDVDGAPTLVITRGGKNAKADYFYDLDDPDSTVLDWDPDVNFVECFNGTDTTFLGSQPSTGYPTRSVMAHEVTRDQLEDFGQNTYQTVRGVRQDGADPKPPDRSYYTCPETAPQDIMQGATRYRQSPARSPWAGDHAALYSHISSWMAMNTATLEVLGDPRITILPKQNAIATVELAIKTPITYFNTTEKIDHYTAGLWEVREVTHRLALGQYTTIYGLQRPGHNGPPEQGDFKPQAGGGGGSAS